MFPTRHDVRGAPSGAVLPSRPTSTSAPDPAGLPVRVRTVRPWASFITKVRVAGLLSCQVLFHT
ncbi:hypothetical protein [Streptomyces sp. NPDC006971]|uniref:hypothetical protein n=1 Tax=Streptomyces sp. NPDC006971 TaxID=3154784 RepID=UPI003407BA18